MEQQKSIRLAMVQLLVTEYKSLANKANLLARAKTLIAEAAEKGAKIVLLPECFNSPYGTEHFATYAEKIPGYSTKFLAELSKELKIHIIGGSIPEVCEDESIYNTCTVFGPDGEMLGKYRKIHLADIDLPGRIAYQESIVLSPGKDLLSFEVGPCKVGVGICYDIRFPELALLYGQQGCNLLVYPSATNMICSAVHWKSLAVARALDNQVYVASCSPARDVNSSYVTWGHSMVVDPWGKVVAEADETEQIIYADIDVDYVNSVRNQIPMQYQKRNDVYKVMHVKE